MTWLLDNWYWLLPTIISVASVITAATPTSKDDAIFAKIRGFLELLALNIGHASPASESKKADEMSSSKQPPASGASGGGNFVVSLGPVWIALGLMLLTAGCSSSPRDYMLMSDTYAATAHGVAAAVRAGAFDDDQLERIHKLNFATKLALDAAEQAVIDDDGFTLSDRMTVVHSYVDELIRLQLIAKQSSFTPNLSSQETAP